MNKAIAIGASASALLAASCADHYNQRLHLRDAVAMEAVVPPKPGLVLAHQAPSLTDVERGDWDETPILVPVDGTAHNPTYVRVRSRVRDLPRQRGEYPMDVSALDLDQGTAKHEFWNAVRQPFRALGNAVLLPFRAIFIRRPWATLQSPREFYERAWSSRGINQVVTGTAPSADEIPPSSLPPTHPVPTPTPTQPAPEPPLKLPLRNAPPIPPAEPATEPAEPPIDLPPR